MHKWINRHDRQVSHKFYSESESMNTAMCDKGLGIWKSYSGFTSDVSDSPAYRICKRCLLLKIVTEGQEEEGGELS